MIDDERAKQIADKAKEIIAALREEDHLFTITVNAEHWYCYRFYLRVGGGLRRGTIGFSFAGEGDARNTVVGLISPRDMTETECRAHFQKGAPS